MVFSKIIDWFAGGSHHYMTLVPCMNHDMFWIGLTVVLDLLVALGYVLIALHWRRNEALLAPSPSKRALGGMKRIFLLCGLCGYLFIPVKIFWPAWRLYDLFLVVLVYSTWRYALGTRNLRVVYEQLEKSAALARDLQESRADGIRKSQFLNAISHDLKTPLNGLMLQAELAEQNLGAEDSRATHEALEEIKSCTKATADLLNRFLELARLDWSQEPNRWQIVDLEEVARSVCHQLRAVALSKGLDLRQEIPVGMTLTSDRVKLERILLNLVDNAIKFTRAGEVRVLAEATSRQVTIHVVDTGVGIKTEHQALIFDEFIQVDTSTHDCRNGFGLGLAIVRRLASQLGGTLAVESRVEVGSRFTFVHSIRTQLELDSSLDHRDAALVRASEAVEATTARAGR